MKKILRLKNFSVDDLNEYRTMILENSTKRPNEEVVEAVQYIDKVINKIISNDFKKGK